MAKVVPFKGMRYNKELSTNLKALTAPPYDIISPDMQKELYEVNPNNVIRLEYGMEQQGDNEQNNKYTRAGKTLEEWLQANVLEIEEKPCYYIYAQEFELKDGTKLTCKGIIGAVRLEEFSKNIILPHEETLSKAKTDRFNLMQATNANFSQIYSLYLDEEKRISPKIDALSEREPDICFTSSEGLLQKLWVINGADRMFNLTEAFSNKQLFIADGHHRYETALRFRDLCRATNPDHEGNEPYNYVMMYLADMDDSGLVVFPTHRMVGDLDNFDENKIIESIQAIFDVEKHNSSEYEKMEEMLNLNKDGKSFAFYTGKDYFYLLKLKDLDAMKKVLPEKSDAYRGLDVSILHTLILEDIMGIGKENLANQSNIIYTRDADEAIRLTAEGKFQCSFLLNPTKVKEIKDVSLATEKMPQKSTYFYPKLVTGLVMNKLK